MALFWHHVFATGNSKVDNYDQLLEQIELFREHGMGNYRDLLLDDREEPDDDLLAGQQPEPRHRGERELGPRTARAVQPRRRQLHRGGRPRGVARLHRLDLRDQDPARCRTAASPGSSSIAPEDHDDGEKDVPRPQGQLQRRGHHRHHRAAAGLRASSSAGTCTTSSSPTSRRCRPGRSRRRAIQRRSTTLVERVPRFEVRDEAGAAAAVQLATSSRKPASST